MKNDLFHKYFSKILFKFSKHLMKILEKVYQRLLTCFVKVRLSPFKKICVICLIESPLEMMKNAFCFILKAFFVLKIFKFLPRHFGHIGKTA